MPGEARALVDTNVLLYAADQAASFHEASRALWDKARAGTVVLCVTPQILWEYFAVITNPKQVAAPLKPEDAWADLEKFRLTLEVLGVPEDLTQRVLELRKTVAVQRAEVFDLVIAVSALAAGLDTIYTYDPKVFSRVPGLTVLEP